MYGQMEATSRMGYLPAERAVEKCSYMGIPVSDRFFDLLEEDGAALAERTGWVSWSAGTQRCHGLCQKYGRTAAGGPVAWRSGTKKAFTPSRNGRGDLSSSMAAGSA